jgi:hypothetical protein
LINAARLPVQRPSGAFRWVGLAAVALLLTMGGLVTVGGLDAAASHQAGARLIAPSGAARHIGNHVGGALRAAGHVLPGQRAFLAQVEQTRQSKRSSLRAVSLVIALFATAIAVRDRRRPGHRRAHGSIDLAGSVRRRGPPACEIACN